MTSETSGGQVGQDGPEGELRLLIVVTGSSAAADLPIELFVIRQTWPHARLRTVVTRSAGAFVTHAALAHRSGGEVVTDEWEDPSRALHVDLVEWAEAILVFPATLDYLSRVAAGRGDSPSVLALQSTRAPVVFVPALPPQAIDGPAYRAHWEALMRRRLTGIVPPRVGASSFTGQAVRGVPGGVADALDLLAVLLQRVRDAVESSASSGMGQS